MEPQPPSIQAWLGLHHEPQPPDGLHPNSAESLRAYCEGVEARLHRLALVIEAMRETLEAAGLLSESGLLAKVQEIDLRDGSADGRQGQPARVRCNNCGRLSSAGRRRCLYCGSSELSLSG